MVKNVQDLVLIPGLNNTKETFYGTIAHMPDSVRCHAVDVPPVTDVDEIADILLEQLPEKFYLLGYSFGGYVTLSMLEKAPERILGLALVCTQATADSEKQKEARQKSIARALAGEHLKMVKEGEARSFYPDNLKNEDIMALREKIVKDYGVERYVAHVKATISRPDRSHVLKNTKIPVLVVAGSDDFVIPLDKQKQMVAEVNEVEFKIIPEAGHSLPIEQPKKLAEELHTWLCTGAKEGDLINESGISS